ncbi:MAG: NAD+ synthase [Rhodopirellula sp.]|nr:NAD+ synthase [Rhodopirellula sp.]
MKTALVQLNPTVGDIRGNLQLVRDAVQQATRGGAELIVLSELVLSGYPPRDLLMREGFVAACDQAVAELAASLPTTVGVVLGHPTKRGVPHGRIANAASLISDGKIIETVHKSLLPNYDVFDERRYFRPADTVRPVEFRGHRLGIHICEDAWWGHPSTSYHDDPIAAPDPVATLAAAGVDVFVNLSASPFEKHKHNRRQELIQQHVAKYGRPFLFVNQVGGNDDLVFDGNSFGLNAAGQVCEQLGAFCSESRIVELPLADALPASSSAGPGVCKDEQEMLDALILGLRDYVRKCGFTDCVLGLSGGIDSALACYIAAEAVGPKQVHGIAMPSRYSSSHSVDDARQLAEALGIDYELIAIDAMHQAYEQTDVVGEDLLSQPGGLADQNLQARIRGAIVMTRSNRHGWMALATGNKSELAVGYCTLYGDMCGGFAVLSDIFKKDVYGISRYINDVREKREVIPQTTISKPPSAELAPDQLDQDTLPPYPILDGILERLIEREESVATVSKHFPAATVAWVAARLDRNEFKRRQMPPGIKLSSRAFGTGRRMPMAARFNIK